MLESLSPVRISPCEQSRSARGALRLNIVLLHDETRLGEVKEVGRLDPGVVPGNIVVAQVVSQDQQDVRASLVLS